MKKAIVFLVLVMMVLGSCSTRQKIVGTWIDDEGELWAFSNDGKVTIDGYQGRYTIIDTLLSLSIDGDSIEFEFSISPDGKTLFLNNTWYGSNTFTKINPINLAEKRWVNGSLTSTSSAVAYTFNAIRGRTYYIWTNDGYDGDGSKSLDTVFTVFDENGDYDDDDDCWTVPHEFTASTNGRVTIVVTACDQGKIGTFAIAYSTSRTRP